MGVKLPIRILLGRTQLSLRDITQLGNGAVVELDCSPDDPVEIIVNDRVIAHGEVVVVSGNYGVRITKIGSRREDAETGQRAFGLVQPLPEAKVTKMFLTLLPYLTVAANLALVLAILLGLNQRVRELRARAGKQDKALETETARLSAEIVELKGKILELEQADNSLSSATAAAAPGQLEIASITRSAAKS